MLPRYPIFIPSRSRFENCLTAKSLARDGVPFSIVVERQQAHEYAARFGEDHILVLPFDNIGKGNLVKVRNWIWEYSISKGAARHWALDDNIKSFCRRYKGKRVPCDAGVALRATEDFVDRYTNVAIAGLNYRFFCADGMTLPPFRLNAHVYSCSLILNSIPYRYRGHLNEDTDLCLQALSGGWCTIQINAFLCDKMATMTVKGGNTQIYSGDGRLRMARELERSWPGVVEVVRRFDRPQHKVADEWKKFDNKLILKPGTSLEDYDGANEYGLKLVQVKENIKSERVSNLLAGEVQSEKPIDSN